MSFGMFLSTEPSPQPSLVIFKLVSLCHHLGWLEHLFWNVLGDISDSQSVVYGSSGWKIGAQVLAII